MFESKSGIFFIAGIFFFGFAFLSNAVVPIMMYRDLPEQKVEDLINPNVRYQFEDLAQRYPEQFKKHIGDPLEEVGPSPVRKTEAGETEDLLSLPIDSLTGAEARQRENYLTQVDAWYDEKCAEMLLLGRKLYTGEGCWHCHSQFVRPVSNESKRWGPVSKSEEYQNELQRPVLFGTRRVGPDLSREAGRRSSDWQAVHLFKPTLLSEGSPMPQYPWYFEGSPDKPTKRGLALLTYLQWLGSWLDSYPYYEDYEESPITKLEAELAVKADDAKSPEESEAETASE